jgi:hypothetical protein
VQQQRAFSPCTPLFSITNVIWVWWCYLLCCPTLDSGLSVACDQILIGLADRRLYGYSMWLKEDIWLRHVVEGAPEPCSLLANGWACDEARHTDREIHVLSYDRRILHLSSSHVGRTLTLELGSFVNVVNIYRNRARWYDVQRKCCERTPYRQQRAFSDLLSLSLRYLALI